jgi:hyperosmotically inducible periplasmic protein
MEKIYTKKTTALALVLVFGVISINAIAFDTDEIQINQTPLAAEFSRLDTTGNGLLMPNEAAKDKLFTKKHFAEADVDRDGWLDIEEYSNYKSAAQQKSLGLAVDDSIITSKAKTEILGTKGLKSLQISVETHKGEVILSGFVDNETAKMKAEEVVSKIDGVKSVKNGLEVKS